MELVQLGFVSGYAFTHTAINGSIWVRLQALPLILGGAALSALRFEYPEERALAPEVPYAGFCSSFATLSSTPFTNCTDSRLENFRAISSDSLITTARGVSG